MMNNMSRHASLRAGYVLVLTLGLLSLAAISLASLARHSLGLAVSVNTKGEEVQRRWALLSTRHFCSGQAMQILDSTIPPDQLHTPPWPKPARHSLTFRLGGQGFSVLIADENAKGNLHVIASRTPDQLGPIVRHLSEGTGTTELRLLPQSRTEKQFETWGQVFDLTNLPTARQAAELVEATQHITLWGSRRLNLRRATDATLREVVSSALSPKTAGELVEARKHWGGGDINTLLAELELRPSQRSAARRLFSNESDDYSIWIEVDNGQRTWSYLFVDGSRPASFAW
jgi:hypothetical protein